MCVCVCVCERERERERVTSGGVGGTDDGGEPLRDGSQPLIVIGL